MRVTRGLRRHRITQRNELASAARFGVEALERRVQLSVSLALSGTQTITPGSVVNASNDDTAWEQEMSLVVNPTNPLNIVGFSHSIDRNTYLGDEIDVFYTTNGGATWSNTVIDDSDDGISAVHRGDPTITFTSEGDVFICYGAYSTGPVVDLIVARSSDGGATFDHFDNVDSVSGSLGLDKWFMTSGVDPSTNNSAVYVAYTSTTGGYTIKVVGCNDLDGEFDFDAPVTVGSPGTFDLFACPAVGPGGELYVSWYDVADNEDELYFDRDLDGLWSSTHSFGTDSVIRNLTNGRLFKEVVNAAPDRGIHTAPILTVDRSGGTYDGRLYVTFIEWFDFEDDDANVKFGYSDNDGTSWTFSTVDSSVGTEFLPWVDVDQATGSVNLLYYSTIDDVNSGNEDVKMRMATSLNGGSSWTIANVTTITSDENENGDETDDSENDYAE